MLVVSGGIEGCDIFPVQAEWRFPALDGHRAFAEAQCHRAGYDFLGLSEECIKRLSQRCEPLAVINQLRVGERQLVFLISRLTVQAESLQFTMCSHDECPARGFVNTARFHADHPILDDVGTTDTVGTADLVEILEKLHWRYAVSVQANGYTLFEVDADFAFAFRTGLGIERQNIQIFRRRLFGIFENPTLMTHVPEVAVAAENPLRCRRNRNTFVFRVRNSILPRLNIPFA